MRGRVVDARTRRPVPGAWVAWQPPPPHLVERLLPTAQPGDPGVADAEGRFSLPRLPDDHPLADTVYAVAPGYGYAAARPGLAPEAELVLALPAAASLEVWLDPPPPPGEEDDPPPAQLVVRALGTDPVAAEVAAGLPPWGPDRERFFLGHLPPGRYALVLDPEVGGAVVREVTLHPGEARQIRLARAPRIQVSGSLRGIGPQGAALSFVDAQTFTRHEAALDEQGRFELELPWARYRAVVSEGDAERALPEPIELPRPDPAARDPRAELHLDLAPREDPRWTLDLRLDGAPPPASELGLVRWEGALGELLPLEATPEGLSVQAPPGRYALFQGAVLLSELSLPPASPETLELRRGEVELRFRLPAALHPDEEVRGTLSLLPAPLAEARPDLAARFRHSATLPVRLSSAAPSVKVPLGWSGSYWIELESDLGPLRATRELRPGAQLELSWSE